MGASNLAGSFVRQARSQELLTDPFLLLQLTCPFLTVSVPSTLAADGWIMLDLKANTESKGDLSVIVRRDLIGVPLSITSIISVADFVHPVILCLGVLYFSNLGLAQNQTVTTAPDDSSSETIVAIRHAEKPARGLGNLNCRGLNRALALPDVLLSKYGQPQFIFAPNPTERFDGGDFNYIRPLITIEPTAIRCELPVNTEFGYTQIDGLAEELRRSDYQNALIFIAWEHGELDRFAKLMVASYGGDPGQVPFWSERDYDTIFVFKIRHENGREMIAFSVDHEELNSLSDSCP